MAIEIIGKLIKERRQFLGLKQEDLAEMSGTTIRSLHSIELGKGNPALTTLEKISAVLGMEVKIEVKDLSNG